MRRTGTGMGWEPKIKGGQPNSAMSSEFDLPKDSPLKFVYAIAFLPRSGSNLLASRMWATGLLGAPIEYFNYSHGIPYLAATLGTKSLEEYLYEVLRRRTSPNGVFGTKLARRHAEFLASIEFDHPVSPLKWVYVDRKDRCAQAVSKYIANQSSSWGSFQREHHHNIEYRYERILQCYRQAETDRIYWTRFFESLDPVRVYYEDIVVDSDAIVSRLLKDWRVPTTPRIEPVVPSFQKQGASRNVEWADRFRAELR